MTHLHAGSGKSQSGTYASSDSILALYYHDFGVWGHLLLKTWSKQEGGYIV